MKKQSRLDRILLSAENRRLVVDAGSKQDVWKIFELVNKGHGSQVVNPKKFKNPTNCVYQTVVISYNEPAPSLNWGSSFSYNTTHTLDEFKKLISPPALVKI